jgi:restriction system protein
MKISSSLTDAEVAKLLQQFYSYFDRESTSETGRVFEEFVREYLVKLGLDEVTVTQRTRDGGIDLIAVRKGFGDFSEADATKYCIQAKRELPTTSISPSKISQLRGKCLSGEKGIFITTAKFSNPATAEADFDSSRPIVLIDGRKLVESCIDHQIGFVFKPVFSTGEMDTFTHFEVQKPKMKFDQDQLSFVLPVNADYVEKLITANDIRARIISIPRTIFDQLPHDVDRICVKVNSEREFQCAVRSPRNYLSGATDILRGYGLLSEDGVANPKIAKWMYDNFTITVNIHIED